MPGSLPFSGARYPLLPEGDNPPADMLRFGTDIDDKLVLKAVSQADRDARYGSVTKGTLVSCAALGVVWQKNSDPPASASWRVLAQNSDPITTGVLTAGANWTVSGQWAKYAGSGYAVTASLTWGGASDIVASGPTDTTPGGLIDSIIGTLVAPWPPISWPVHARTTSAAGTLSLRNADGAIVLTDLATSSKVRVGDTISFATTYPIA